MLSIERVFYTFFSKDPPQRFDNAIESLVVASGFLHLETVLSGLCKFEGLFPLLLFEDSRFEHVLYFLPCSVVRPKRNDTWLSHHLSHLVGGEVNLYFKVTYHEVSIL